MESYDVLLNLAMIDVEEDHYTFVQSLVWMLDACGYLREIAADPNNESEVHVSNMEYFSDSRNRQQIYQPLLTDKT